MRFPRKLVLEKKIEKSVIRYYKKKLKKFLADPKAEKDGPLKLNGMGRRAWPDRLFPGPYGRFMMIEFKRRGKKPTPAQAHVHLKLARLGHKVHVVDDEVVGKELIDKLFDPRPSYLSTDLHIKCQAWADLPDPVLEKPLSVGRRK